MIPRSSIGRSIVKEVDTGVSQTVEQSQERKIVLKKKTRESLLGVRFGLHPVSGQVVVTQMFDGYPAASSGRIFIGDVLTAVNGVMVTSVDMATQVIKLAEDRVELKTTNVYVNASNPGSRRASATRPRRSTGAAPRSRRRSTRPSRSSASFTRRSTASSAG